MFPLTGRVWNTWDAAAPTAFCHLQTGLVVRLSLYSSKESRYLLPSAGDVRFREHELDGSLARCEVAFGGSTIELTFEARSDFEIVARTRMLSLGEWGLRFWYAFEVGFDERRLGPPPYLASEPHLRRAADSSDGLRLQARYRSRVFAVASAQEPSFSGLYPDSAAYGQAIGEFGYYVPDPEEAVGRWSALRFNAEMHPEVQLVIAQRDEAAVAAAAATQLLTNPGAASEPEAIEPAAAARSAVRDVVGWNTVWDHVHARPTTVLTRNWVSGKFGGWGVWLDDMLFHSVLASSCGDFELALANLDAAIGSSTPAGNLACLLTQTQEWVDRSQPPIAAYALWRLFDRTGDVAMVRRYVPVLLRSHEWWFSQRDGGDGLLSYGSSSVGRGAFVGTKQAAMDESFMDNSPMFDFAEFDTERRTLDVAEPGLNSLVSLEGQLLARMLRILGDPESAGRLEARSEALNARISERLWDSTRGVFCTRKRTGEFSRSLTPTSFYPLLAGAASAEQRRQLIDNHLYNPAEFWRERVLPSSTFDDPASADNVYWRGRVWGPHLMLVWEGLRRAEEFEAATAVADAAWRMFEPGWSERGWCMENYSADPAVPDESPDADPFYTWGALCALLPCLDAADASPWGGRMFAPGADPGRLMESGRRWEARRIDDQVVVELNGATLLRASGAGRVSVDLVGCRLSVRTDARSQVTVAGVSRSQVVHATLRGEPHELAGDDQPVTVTVDRDEVLDLWLREPLDARRSW